MTCGALPLLLLPPAGGGEAEQQQRVSPSPLEPAATRVQESRGDEKEVHSGVGVLRLLHLQHLQLPQGEAHVCFNYLKNVIVY